MSLPRSHLFVSTLIVGHNAVKNILFRGATYVLQFAALRLFAYLAFKRQDYTSFLMFAEDIIQKAMFAFSRKFNRQTILVTTFALVTTAVGFYDTLLWALDAPGYILQSKTLDASSLSSQILDSPAYISFLSNPMRNSLNSINLNDTLGANLYTTGLNFSLSGIVAARTRDIIPPVRPLDTLFPPRIWLDTEGFAVGLDDLIMVTPGMNTTDGTACLAQTVPTSDTIISWNCPVHNNDAFDLFNNQMGVPQIWWDFDHAEYLYPIRKENPWQSLGAGGETALMKQVFTVTKGYRRHTFVETCFKATMIQFPPMLFDDAEITDFMRRTWSADDTQPMTPAVQTLADMIIAAKNNQTSRTFGSLLQASDYVTSVSTDYMLVAGTPSGDTLYAALRFASTTITLLRSETIVDQPVPFAPCPLVYRNIATGGVVRSTNCYLPIAENQTAGHFLGQIDTSAVVIMSDILGDGTSNISAVAINETGVSWYTNNSDRIDQLLISRALILGGTRADVQVDVQYTKAAISLFQLVLVLFPLALAITIWCLTSRESMSYFENSFLAAVFATTHFTTSTRTKIGYMRHPPEVVIQDDGAHLTLATPHTGAIVNLGGAIANLGTKTIGDGLIYEPLILEKDYERTGHLP